MAYLTNGTLNYNLTQEEACCARKQAYIRERNIMDPTYPDPNDSRFTDPAPVFTIQDNQLYRDGVAIGKIYNNKTGKIVEIDTITEDSFSYKDTSETAIITQDISVTTVSKLTGLKSIQVHDYSNDYLTFVAKESGTFTFVPKNSNVISYSTDNGTTWTEGNSVTVNNGDKVMWKGTMAPAEWQGIGIFSSTANFDVQGNAMSLLFGDNYKGETDLTGKNYAFYYLFSGNTKVVNAENLSLPAETLASNCYYSMFYNCISLTTAPELPATTLAQGCYWHMFNGCTSLTTAPELPATTLASACYNQMFQGCTSLTTAPELPATTLASSCYSNMFNGCTSLTTAPQLPAETLANGCYGNMFQGCTSLTTAPELPATTLASSCYSNMFSNTNIIPDCSNIDFTSETIVSSGGLIGLFGGTKITDADLENILPKNTNGKYCLPATTLVNQCYQNMFRDCTSLTTAPELPATTLANYCYDRMFYGCTNLNHIKAMFTTTPSSTYTQNWVIGVSASGTFVKNAAAEWDVSGVNGIPSGWTVQTE